MRCPFYIILCTCCIQSPIYHRTFFNNTLNCFLLLILQLQQPVCCLLCCLVYSILSSWISMELCIFPYQHRRGPRPTRAQKGLTVYSVGHSLPTSRGLSFHISLLLIDIGIQSSVGRGLTWGSVCGLGWISDTSLPLLPMPRDTLTQLCLSAICIP